MGVLHPADELKWTCDYMRILGVSIGVIGVNWGRVAAGRHADIDIVTGLPA